MKNKSADLKDDERNTWTDRWYYKPGSLFIGTSILLLFSLWLITRPAWFNFFDFASGKTSSIGDTIGGITNPIIGLVGAILVYVSFREQFEANRLQRESLEEEKEARIAKEWENTVDYQFQALQNAVEKSNFTFRIENSAIEESGWLALLKWSANLSEHGHLKGYCTNPILGDFTFVTVITGRLLETIGERHRSIYETHIGRMVSLFISIRLSASMKRIIETTNQDIGVINLKEIVSPVYDKFKKFEADSGQQEKGIWKDLAAVKIDESEG